MQIRAGLKCAAASAVGLLVASCGGGGGGGATPPAPQLQLSGFAATGYAMENAGVQAICASGTGSASADRVGRYTIIIAGGALPCVLRAEYVKPGLVPAPVTYSLAETGTTGSDQVTHATAQITPVTEMVLAYLFKAPPSTWFASFDAARGSQATTARLQEATAAVLAALRTGAGIDFGSIDPFKGELIPSTGTNTPNQHDKLLDRIALNRYGLDELMFRIVAARGAQDLADAMLAASGGSLGNCFHAVSGKYRMLDYAGRTVVRAIDFKEGTMSSTDGGTLAITPQQFNNCGFTAAGSEGGQDVVIEVVLGSESPAGFYRSRATAPVATPGTIGYIVPVQSQPVAALTGTTWRYLRSGYAPGGAAEHTHGGLEVGADHSLRMCQFDLDSWSCTPLATTMSIAERSDGGFDVTSGGASTGMTFYGYRTNGGVLNLFGTTNAAGAEGAGVTQTHLVAVELGTLSLPGLGTAGGGWQVQQTDVAGTRQSTSPVEDHYTIVARDTAAGTATRRDSSDGQEEVIRYNSPVAGLRQRDAAGALQALTHLPLPGLDLTVQFNTEPAPAGSHIYRIVQADR